jgi:hypothetical protein
MEDDEPAVLPPPSHNIPPTAADQVAFGSNPTDPGSDANSPETDALRIKLLNTMHSLGYAPNQVLKLNEQSDVLKKLSKMNAEQLKIMEMMLVAETQKAPSDMVTSVVNQMLKEFLDTHFPSVSEQLFRPEVVPRLTSFLYSLSIGKLSPLSQAAISTACTLFISKFLNRQHAPPTPRLGTPECPSDCTNPYHGHYNGQRITKLRFQPKNGPAVELDLPSEDEEDSSYMETDDDEDLHARKMVVKLLDGFKRSAAKKRGFVEILKQNKQARRQDSDLPTTESEAEETDKDSDTEELTNEQRDALLDAMDISS